jgi:hypothetical protein
MNQVIRTLNNHPHLSKLRKFSHSKISNLSQICHKPNYTQKVVFLRFLHLKVKLQSLQYQTKKGRRNPRTGMLPPTYSKIWPKNQASDWIHWTPCLSHRLSLNYCPNRQVANLINNPNNLEALSAYLEHLFSPKTSLPCQLFLLTNLEKILVNIRCHQKAPSKLINHL